MKPLRWTTTEESHEYMKMRKSQNVIASRKNKNESWFHSKLKKTHFKWKRQSQWGYRIFDFWCSSLGVAIEIDGPEHDQKYDHYRDEYNFRRSGIVVLRVRNKNEDDASRAISLLYKIETWQYRKSKLGISWKNRKNVRKIAKQVDESISFLDKYIESLDKKTLPPLPVQPSAF